MYIRLFLMILFWVLSKPLLAQKTKGSQAELDPIESHGWGAEVEAIDSVFMTHEPITLELENKEKEEEKKLQEKKKSKKVFYGVKTKKAFTKKRYRGVTTFELFFVLKDYPRNFKPDPYIRDFFWFHVKKRKIINSKKINPKYGRILHGSYKRTRNEKARKEVVLEKGIFYYGVKHGRWERYGKYMKEYILTDKKKFFRGWPKESKIIYFDERKQERPKEITPIQHGLSDGEYYLFYTDGQVALRGEYAYDEKIGVWTEYYKSRHSRKRQIQYQKKAGDKNFTPHILREWDKRGRIIYDVHKSKNRPH